MVFREDETLPNAPIYQLIPWELLQGIAIIELYRKKRWIEPAGEKKMPASLIFHQTLSILASKGSLTAQRLAKEVLSLSPFSQFTKEQYKDLLVHMLKEDYLQLTDEKELIVGLKGERMLSSFKFFAVFKDSEDFTVRHGSEEIGSISSTPPIGERFALAGRVWSVDEIDVSKKLIYVSPVEGKMKISWPGDNGFIHTKILEKMREVLSSDESYPYLLPKAAKRLEEARRLAKKTGVCEKAIVSLGGNSFVFFPWLGTKAFQALKRILQKEASFLDLYDIQSGLCYYITFKSEKTSPDQVISALKEKLTGNTTVLEDLVTKTEYPSYDKFDPCLPHALLLDSFVKNRLDLEEVKKKFAN